MTKGEIIRFLILRTIGNFLVLFALYGVGATFGPALYYEVQFRIIQARGVTYTIPNVILNEAKDLGDSSPSTVARGQNDNANDNLGGGFASVLTGPKEQILIPKDTEFSILIPKIGASAKVFANIDPVDEKAFLPVLKEGVAHAKGTVFPGMKGNIYLFAHSTDNFWDVGRYNAIFYLLKDLRANDQIVLFFENKRHNYIVSDLRILEAADISYLVSDNKNEENLILQTCWPPGTTWKRLIVIAKPK